MIHVLVTSVAALLVLGGGISFTCFLDTAVQKSPRWREWEDARNKQWNMVAGR